MLFQGNTKRRGTYITVVLMQATIVTSEPLCAEDKETRRLTLKEIALYTLC
jgi:hypothetical protein